MTSCGLIVSSSAKVSIVTRKKRSIVINYILCKCILCILMLCYIPSMATAAPSANVMPDADIIDDWSADMRQLGANKKAVTSQAAHLVKPNHVRNITAQVGQTVFLHCIIDNTGTDKTVTWFRLRDFQVLTVGTTTYIPDDRFKTSNMQYANNWALQIQHLNQTDAGLYECSLNTNPPRRQFISLTIVVPIARIQEGQDLHVETGSTINVTCLVEGSPEPPAFVFWYHDGRMINYDRERSLSISLSKSTLVADASLSRLFIHDANPTRDSGNYTCAPANARPVSVQIYVLDSERRIAAIQNDGTIGLTGGATISRLNILHLLFTLYFLYHQLTSP